MNKTTLYLPADLHRRLREVARRSGRPQADVIRSALDAYLEDRKADRPRSIAAGADDALIASESEDWLREQWRAR